MGSSSDDTRGPAPRTGQSGPDALGPYDVDGDQQSARDDAPSTIRQFSTRGVLPEQRSRAWEYFNRKLIDLEARTQTPGGHGLLATIRGAREDGITYSMIAAEPHTVERTGRLIESRQDDAVRMTVVRRGGDGVLYRPDGLVTLRPGELVIYSSDAPFMLGFTRKSLIVTISVSRDLLETRGLADAFDQPLVLPADHDRYGAQARRITGLIDQTDRYLTTDDPAYGSGLGERALAALAIAAGGTVGDGTAHYLSSAKEFIALRLDDTELAPEGVAAAVGLSSRQLARVFAAEGTSPGRYIHDERLVRAREDLESPLLRDVPVGQIGARWGFPSAAHFSRAFRRKYDVSPSSVRPKL